MYYKDCLGIVIHSKEYNPERRELINILEKDIRKIIIFEAIMVNHYSQEDKDNLWSIFGKIDHFKKKRNIKCAYGAIGCFLSHLEVFSYIIENKLNSVIVFEDDCGYRSEKSRKLFLDKEIDSDYDIVYLGCNMRTHATYYKNWKTVLKIFNFILENRDKWLQIDTFLIEYLPILDLKFTIVNYFQNFSSLNSRMKEYPSVIWFKRSFS
jgi:GR25 family glycosyltransferase involved in LPS biosynthesis